MKICRYSRDSNQRRHALAHAEFLWLPLGYMSYIIQIITDHTDHTDHTDEESNPPYA